MEISSKTEGLKTIEGQGAMHEALSNEQRAVLNKLTVSKAEYGKFDTITFVGKVNIDGTEHSIGFGYVVLEQDGYPLSYELEIDGVPVEDETKKEELIKFYTPIAKLYLEKKASSVSGQDKLLLQTHIIDKLLGR